MEQGRGTQVVRERSAKPLCVGSIPTRASTKIPAQNPFRGGASETLRPKNTFIFAQAQRQPLRNVPVCGRSSCPALGCVVTFRPRICHVLSALRIHSPDCKHCAAYLTCGNDLRKRLGELNEPSHPVQSQSFPYGFEMVPSERTKRRRAA